MQKVTLKVDQRQQKGKGAAGRMRREGIVPAVLYGRKKDPINLSLNAHEFGKIYERLESNPIFELQINTGSETLNRAAVIKERQVRPVDGSLVHLDFLEVSMDEAIEIVVPVHYEGDAIGVEKGGQFQIILRELKVSALPDRVPGVITVDISKLDMGHSIHISEIALPEGVTAVQDGATALATILSPKKADEGEKAEEAESV